MKLVKYSIVVVLFTLLSNTIRAQVNVSDLPDEVVYKGLRFKINTSWFSVHGGMASTIEKPGSFGLNNYGLDYNIPAKRDEDMYNFYNMGLTTYGDNRYLRAYNFHGGYGWRKPRRKYNLSAFVGPSATIGYFPADSVDIYTSFRSIGIIAQAEAVYKVIYDVGIGTSVFVNYDFTHPVYGIRFNLYFSNSYKGKSRNQNDSE